MSNNLCTKEKYNFLADSIKNYKISYTKYLIDKEEIENEKKKIEALISEKNVELQNNLLNKNQEFIKIKCNSENSHKDCYLKCKEKFNPTDRKPDIMVSTKCKVNSLDSEFDLCECTVPDYKNIDKSINEINELLRKKLDLLEKEFKLVKPENLTIQNPCCAKDILCANGECTSIDEFCKIKPVVESFTTNNDYTFNTNHVLIIIIIILIIFYMCQK